MYFRILYVAVLPVENNWRILFRIAIYVQIIPILWTFIRYDQIRHENWDYLSTNCWFDVKFDNCCIVLNYIHKNYNELHLSMNSVDMYQILGWNAGGTTPLRWYFLNAFLDLPEVELDISHLQHFIKMLRWFARILI